VAQFLRPSSIIARGQWDSAAYSVVSEVTPQDSSRTASDIGRVGAYIVFGLPEPDDTPAPATMNVRVRVARTRKRIAFNSTGQNPQYQLRLYQGDTLVAQDVVRVAAPIAASGSGGWLASLFWFLNPRFETIRWSLNSATITDWTDLRLEVEIVGFDNPTLRAAGISISWVEVEVPDEIIGPLDESITTGAPRVASATLMTGAELSENRLLLSGEEQTDGQRSNADRQQHRHNSCAARGHVVADI
jgi:hypothetical protein